MKILIVNKFLHPNGGSETYVFEIGKQLIKMGHQVQYFGMDHPERVVGNASDIYTQNMDFHTGQLQKLIYPFKIIYSFEAQRKMMALLRSFQPDVVHLNNFNFQLTPSLFYAIKKYSRRVKRRLPIVYTAHDYQWVCPNHLMKIPSDGRVCFACKGGKFINCTRNKCIHGSVIKSVLGTLEGYFYKWHRSYRMTDAIICPSDFMKQKLSTDRILSDKVITMHNFLPIAANYKNEINDLNEMGNTVTREVTASNHLTFLSDAIKEKGYLLYFGRYSQEKGVGMLLETCRRLSDISFVFAGKGELLSEVQKVKNVVDVGFRSGEELSDLIRTAKFVIFPSECYENCPFSVMEAQMYGTPVLASAIGGTVELIRAEETGEFFQPGNIDELTTKILNLWDDKTKLAYYKSNCKKISFDTLEQYCEKLFKIYESLGSIK
ncbi:MAG: glycosyltransferase family 4 protein [Lachnospiraceae bacterium]|jgi:glycosyltransferase involved in cell wall biosynthesis|nr:glycosyltransferase family 4 protein [Lachnospiraceae bacterium]